MPTYDYECSNGHRFDYLQSITAEPLTECVTCGEPVRRLIGGGAGIIFKGSGFYVTDSKNGNRDKKASAKDTDGKSDTDNGQGQGQGDRQGVQQRCQERRRLLLLCRRRQAGQDRRGYLTRIAVARGSPAARQGAGGSGQTSFSAGVCVPATLCSRRSPRSSRSNE